MSRTAVIVGFGKLMSFELVKKLVATGHKVLVLSRSMDKMVDLINIIDSERVVPIEADAMNDEELVSAISDFVSEHGRLDLLHYHLGYGPAGKPTTLSKEVVERMHHLGTWVPLRLVKRFSGDLEKSDGTFLVTGGGLAINPMADYSAMSIANAAKRNLVKTLFEEFRDRVHVATVTISMMIPDNETASRVADTFMELYGQPKDEWQSEVIYSEE